MIEMISLDCLGNNLAQIQKELNVKIVNVVFYGNESKIEIEVSNLNVNYIGKITTMLEVLFFHTVEIKKLRSSLDGTSCNIKFEINFAPKTGVTTKK